MILRPGLPTYNILRILGNTLRSYTSGNNTPLSGLVKQYKPERFHKLCKFRRAMFLEKGNSPVALGSEKKFCLLLCRALGIKLIPQLNEILSIKVVEGPDFLLFYLFEMFCRTKCVPTYTHTQM